MYYEEESCGPILGKLGKLKEIRHVSAGTPFIRSM